MKYTLILTMLLVAPSCSSFMQSSSIKEELAWKKDLESNLQALERNGHKNIPVYFLVREDCEYGAYDGTPKKVGTITTDDLKRLLDQERIPPRTETLDYWYALQLGLSKESPDISLSLTPCEKLGFTLLYKDRCERILDNKLHKKMLKMLQ